MALSIVMPALEIAQETGKILSWRKKEGERVTKGEPLFEVETDKAVVEIEAPGDGILAAVQAAVGAVIPVGKTIAWLVQPGEALPSDVPQPQSGRRSDSPNISTAAPISGQAGQAPASETRISPKARRLAREHGVDFTRMRGSGPGGEILAEDILSAVSAQNSIGRVAGQPGVEALSTVGRLMAERTTQSWTSVPHFFLLREIDASSLVAAHRKLGSQAGPLGSAPPTITDLLIFLIARTLQKHPRLNASWAGEGIRHNQQVNVGVAMATLEGVVVGVIQSADTASLADIAVARRGLTERAKAGKLQPPDISGATFTISNLGMYGVDAFTAIIVPPQAAILAVARIADRVVPVDGQPAIRPMLTLTLSSDHRVVDGARAAEFMKDLAEAIGESHKWLI